MAPGPGVQAATPSNSCTTALPSGADYLCKTYQIGRAKAGWSKSGPFDHIGQHLYIDQGGATSSPRISEFLQDVRQTYLAFEGSSTPKRTEITEFGWNTLNAGVSQTVQSQNLRTSYSTFRSTSFVRRAFWFRTQDLPWDGHGLIDFEWDGTAVPKGSFAAYQESAAF
jgi:hypothetical protein